ncbi:eCIS core domain-containing protein [Actinacidiphila reveromycinica]
MHAHEQVNEAAAARRPRSSALPRPAVAGPPPARGMTAAGVLALQRTAGNSALTRALDEEARHTHGAGCGHGPSVQRSQVHDVLSGSGRALAAPLRAEMEARLGADFGDVRVHDDSAARRSAASLGARAYTSGNHVVVGEGGADKHTLAHELTHVIQQRSGPVAGTATADGLRVSDPGDAFERAAESNAQRAMSGPVPVQTAPERDGTGRGGPEAGQQASPAPELAGTPAIQRVTVPSSRPSGSGITATQSGGRTTSIEMLNSGSLAGSPPSQDPPGFDYIRALRLTNFWIRFHLINNIAGGPGTAANLVPASKRDNANYEHSIEALLKATVSQVRRTNRTLQPGQQKDYVYFGVDVHYAHQPSRRPNNMTQRQYDAAGNFVNGLTIYHRVYDGAARTWTVHHDGTYFGFHDRQPTDPGTHVRLSQLDMTDLRQLTGNYRGWNNDDLYFLNDLGTTRRAEFEGLIDHYGATGPAESVLHAFHHIPFSLPRQSSRSRRPTAQPTTFADRMGAGADGALQYLALAISGGSLTIR